MKKLFAILAFSVFAFAMVGCKGGDSSSVTVHFYELKAGATEATLSETSFGYGSDGKISSNQSEYTKATEWYAANSMFTIGTNLYTFTKVGYGLKDGVEYNSLDVASTESNFTSTDLFTAMANKDLSEITEVWVIYSKTATTI